MLCWMRQTSFANVNCSLAQSLELIGDWWTPLILRDVFVGIDKFDDLAVDLGISRNLLTSRLSDLVGYEIIKRVPYSERPPRDRYVLTEAGGELMPILAALTAWGDRWTERKNGPPMLFRHKACGHVMTPQVACSRCGKVLNATDLDAVGGPGAKAGPGTRLLAKRVSPLAAR